MDWGYIQTAAPGGVRLLPNFWPKGNLSSLNVKLPSYVVSLMLQYTALPDMNFKMTTS
jgi:hypothetical protein